MVLHYTLSKFAVASLARDLAEICIGDTSNCDTSPCMSILTLVDAHLFQP